MIICLIPKVAFDNPHFQCLKCSSFPIFIYWKYCLKRQSNFCLSYFLILWQNQVILKSILFIFNKDRHLVFSLTKIKSLVKYALVFIFLNQMWLDFI